MLISIRYETNYLTVKLKKRTEMPTHEWMRRVLHTYVCGGLENNDIFYYM